MTLLKECLIMTAQFLLFLFICIVMLIYFSTKSASQNVGIGANMANIDVYADSLSLVWYIESVPEGYVIPARIRTDNDKLDVLHQATIDKTKQFCRIAIRMNRIPEICYTVNLWASASVNLDGIRQLKSLGYSVPIIEMGNEYYSIIKDNYGSINWSYYVPIITPIRDLIRASYPDVIFVYPACPSPTGSGIAPERNDHANWNNGLRDYLITQPSGDGVVWHTYYDKYDYSQLNERTGLVKQNNYSGSVLNTYLDTYYSNYFDSCYISTLWDKVITYCQNQFSGRDVYFTEYGTVGSSFIRNTWAYSALTFRDGIKYRDFAERMYIHAGINLVGIIQPVSTKYDDLSITTSNIRRLEYWSTYMVNRIPVETSELSSYNFLAEGDNYFWFINSGDDFIPQFEIPEGYEIRVSSTYIKGNFIYNSLGLTYWMGTGSSRVQDISGLTYSSENIIKGLSYGYTVVTLTKKPVVVCMKKRWLFSGCKTAKKDCNC